MKQRVVLVGKVERSLDAIMPVLDRYSVEALELPEPSLALAMVRELPVDLVIAAVPFKGLKFPEFLRLLRNEGGESRGAEVLALSPKRGLKTLQKLKDSRLRVALEAGKDDLEDLITSILRRSPRIPSRTMVTMTIESAERETKHMLQMGNLSETGMFLRTRSRPEIGAKAFFEFTLTERGHPVSGVGRVVRHASREEGGPGLGLRFENLEGDSGERLKTALARYIELRDQALAR